MADEEVTIRITAKNLTEAAFKQARKEVLGLGSDSEKAGAKTTSLRAKMQGFFNDHQQSFRAIGQAAGLAVGAVTGLGAAVVALGLRGATVGDVASSFEQLAGGSETAQAALAALRKGTAGTVSDFVLMKAANTALRGGLKASADDMGTLAAGSRMLAKQTGGDTAATFNRLTEALNRGGEGLRGFAGLSVDTTRLTKEYAAAQGIATSEVTKAQKEELGRQEVLRQLRARLAETGEQSRDFGEQIEFARSQVTNWTDALGVAINDSPVVAAGMNEIATAAGLAFGGDKTAMVQRLTGFVNGFAIGLTHGADVLVFFGQRGNEVFTAMNVVIASVGTAITFVAEQIAGSLEGVLSVGEKIPVLGDQFTPARQAMTETRVALNGMREDYQAQVGEAIDAGARNKAALDQVSAAIGATRLAMVNAKNAQAELSATTREHEPVIDEQIVKLQQQAAAHVQFAADASKATTDFLSTQKFASDEGIAIYQAKIDAQTKLDQEYRALQNQFAEAAMMREAVLYQTTEERAAAAGFQTRAELQATADQALALYQEMQDSGEFAALALTDAWEKYESAQRAAAGETSRFKKDADSMLLTNTASTLAILGSKFKAASIAGAIISTYQAIAKSLASLPWPVNLISAAGAAAAGWANVSRIRSSSPGFRTGTPALDFQRFSPSGQSVVVHGEEAVIPRGGGHKLAREIAGALAMMRGGQTRVAAAGSGAGVMHVMLQLPSGRVLAEETVPFLPGALKRLGYRI